MWHLSMHGSTDHLDPAVAEEIEVAVRDAAAEIMATLVPAGHQGVAGQFAYSSGGPSDLRDAAPHPDPAAVEAPAVANPVSTVPAEVASVEVAPGTAAGG